MVYRYITRFWRPAAMLVLACLLIPPGCSAARDGWLLIASGDQRQAARWIIMRDILRAKGRLAETPGPRLPPGQGGIILPVMPPHDMTRDIATCPDFIVPVPPGSRVRERRPGRSEMVDDVALGLLEERTSNLTLILVNACLRTTPFAPLCAGSFGNAPRDDRAIVERLIGRTAIRREAGGLCWARPEFREGNVAVHR